MAEEDDATALWTFDGTLNAVPASVAGLRINGVAALSAVQVLPNALEVAYPGGTVDVGETWQSVAVFGVLNGAGLVT